MKRSALALCGGGGKGAYQIGVWCALEELGITKKISALSGTSVGALNAVLLALGDIEKAKKIWFSIRQETLLSYDKRSEALFSRDGLIGIMSSIDLEKLRRTIPVYINVYNKTLCRTESFKLNDRSVSDIKKLLLASSALPIAYEEIEYNGNRYMDAGWNTYGNTPIEILYNEGYRDIYISPLSVDFNLYDMSENVKKIVSRVDVSGRFPDASFTVLQPLNDLGNILTGTLKFSAANSRRLMADGYKDTLKILRGELTLKNKHT